MADTKIAPRRLPFPIGTKMVFAQAAVPPDWSLDTSDDDRFFRVVNGGTGGTVAGPDNATLTNPTDSGGTSISLNHRHGLGAHVHDMSAHDHTYSHSHSGPSITDGMVTGGGVEDSADYRLTDDSAFGWRFRVSGSRHLAVDSGADEGEHDHTLPNVETVSAITQGSNTTNTGTENTSDGNKSTATNIDHTHTVDTAWAPRYLDVVVGSLVG